ncbi:type IV secretory system conjugative DNA transfer family protein [Collibacillus ludicampi]|nr:type IV secretory system conjugative DNA transfer family protein [Collibacillus ludicampi]
MKGENRMDPLTISLLSPLVSAAKPLIGSGAIGYTLYRLFQNQTPYDHLKQYVRHVHIMGINGSGKTTKALEIARSILSDVRRPGLLWIDTHGESSWDLVKLVPENRWQDVIWFDPQADRVVGFNPLQMPSGADAEAVQSLITGDLVDLLSDLYGAKGWGENIEEYIMNATLALLEYSQQTQTPVTLLDVPRFMLDSQFYRTVMDHIDNVVVRDMWEDFFKNRTENAAQKELDRAKRKLRKPLASSFVLETLCQPEGGLIPEKAIEEGKIVIARLTRNPLGSVNQRLLAGMLTSRFIQAGLSRKPERQGGENNKFFYLFLDEFQSYMKALGDSVEEGLAQLRKYRVGIFLIHQGLFQLEGKPFLRAAVDQTATKFLFTVDTKDGGTIEKYLGVTPEQKKNKQGYTAARMTGFPQLRTLHVWSTPQGRHMKEQTVEYPKPIRTDEEARQLVEWSITQYGEERWKVKEYLRTVFQKDLKTNYDGVIIDVDVKEGKGESQIETERERPADTWITGPFPLHGDLTDS